jgi:hypothetical protein
MPPPFARATAFPLNLLQHMQLVEHLKPLARRLAAKIGSWGVKATLRG